MTLLMNQNLRAKAISWDSHCFKDLDYFCRKEGVFIDRIDPDRFINEGPKSDCQYINLVIKDLDLRRTVSDRLNDHPRFSFVHDSAVVDPTDIGVGCFIYPFTVTLRSNIGDDVVCFGHNGVAHGCAIGRGTILGSYSYTAGSSKVGEFCHLHSRVTVYDKIYITNNVILASGSCVRKSIVTPGTYTVTSTGILKQVFRFASCADTTDD